MQALKPLIVMVLRIHSLTRQCWGLIEVVNRNVHIVRFNRRNDNLGDQYIFKALVDELNRYGVVFCSGQAPSFVTQCYSLPEKGLFRRVFGRMTRWFSNKIFSFSSLGGLGYITPNLAQKNATNGFEHSNRRSRIKEISIGRSVISTSDCSWVKKYSVVGVRDRASLNAIQVVAGERGIYFPDMSFLPSFCSKNYRQRRALVGFSFREYFPSDKCIPNEGGCLSEFIAEASSVLRNSQLDTECFYQVEEDKAYMTQVSDCTGVALHANKLTLRTFEKYYFQCKFIFSNRLHVLLLAARCGAIPVAVTPLNHEKIYSLYETIGWRELLFTGYCEPNMTEVLEALICNERELCKLVNRTILVQRETAKSLLYDIVA